MNFIYQFQSVTNYSLPVSAIVRAHACSGVSVLQKVYIALPITELRSITCHMGSHSVTCHPTQVNAPHLTADRLVLSFPTLHEGMEG